MSFVKPDPQIFAIACASLGLSADEVLMVGDDPRSDGGAVMAGVRTLLLPPCNRDPTTASILFCKS